MAAVMMKLFINFAVIILSCHFADSVPALDTQITSSALTFLESFGYLSKPDPRSGKLMSEDAISVSIKRLQRFAGLNVTGKLDSATAKQIQTPRCGLPDVGPMDNAKRKRRYVQQGSKWLKEDLTWRLANSNNDGLSDKKVSETMVNAFKKWSDATNLNFKKIKTGTPDIWVRFVRGYHQDSYPFDGLGGTLAHAFYPMNNKGISGDVHFDDDEEYTIDSANGKNLLWVAVHELGHSIGLEHSNLRGAIMFPWYQRHHKGKDFQLTDDDIRGIQTIYGYKAKKEKRTPAPNPETHPPKATNRPSYKGCADRIQAIILGNDQKTYVINKDTLYILGTSLQPLEGPLPLKDYFTGLKSVDAAFQRQSDKKTVFFSKDKFYVFNGKTLFRGPRQISDGFTGLSKGFSDISASFVWPGNNKLYIFKGSHYYRFSRNRNNNDYTMDYGYPRLITSAWKKVPANIDSVFTWRNGKSYFFKGTKYYRLDNKKIEVAFGYPKSIANVWFYCSENLQSDVESDSCVLQVTISTMALSIIALIKLL